MPIADREAPELLKLLGHDVRWQLLRTLARSDHRVNELVEVTGYPQNLVSYHLRLLRSGELVVERRSSADARDVYYHLDLDRLQGGLTDSAALLSVAIESPTAGQRGTRNARGNKPRVLFICTGNSARSQMAEAILRRELGSALDVHSAGPAPTVVHPLALQVLRDMGVATAGLRSKGLEELQEVRFDVVISLCDKAKEACPPDDPKARYIHWSLPDPALVSGSSARRRRAFEMTAAEIASRVRHLKQAFTARGGLDRVRKQTD